MMVGRDRRGVERGRRVFGLGRQSSGVDIVDSILPVDRFSAIQR
jgi:hypothetical protein